MEKLSSHVKMMCMGCCCMCMAFAMPNPIGSPSERCCSVPQSL